MIADKVQPTAEGWKVRILGIATALVGSRSEAERWFDNQQLPGFPPGSTPQQLVNDGRGQAVLEYLEEIRFGGFA